MKQYLVEHQQSRCFSNIHFPFLLTPRQSDENVHPPSNSSSAVRFSLSHKDYYADCYTSIQDVPYDWDRLAEGQDLFMGRTYLAALENHPPEPMSFVYLVLFHHDQAVGLAYGQTYPIQLGESIRDYSSGSTWEERLKSWIGKTFSFHMLIFGNALLSGQHHLIFDDHQIKAGHFYELIQESWDKTAAWLRSTGKKVQVMMVKDLTEAEQQMTGKLEAAGFHNFPFQPSMSLKLQSGWNSFDDYLDAMSSKYRVRARRAFKKGKAMQRVELDTEHLPDYQSVMYDLYQNVAEKADFSLIELHPEYIPSLKKTYRDQFTILGYFVGQELVGYCTTLHNGAELEAHFLGIAPKANRKYQLYLNMLYDMIKIGIKLGVERIVFSRTALEIKSSVGATPEVLHCYLRHRNSLLNLLLPFFVRYLEPEVQWRQRHPFKNVDYSKQEIS